MSETAEEREAFWLSKAGQKIKRQVARDQLNAAKRAVARASRRVVSADHALAVAGRVHARAHEEYAEAFYQLRLVEASQRNPAHDH